MINNEAMKDDNGKLQYHLLPQEETEEIVKVLMYGAKKYGYENWKRGGGLEFNRIYDASIRHLEALRKGEKSDNESELLHAAHLAVNAIFLIHYQLNLSINNDLDITMNKERMLEILEKTKRYDARPGNYKAALKAYENDNVEEFKAIYRSNFDCLEEKKIIDDWDELGDGEGRSYWFNGQLECRVNYKNGKRDGVGKSYHDNGQLQHQANYKDGKRDGLYEEYYEDGRLKYRINYKNGKDDGLYEKYYKNGQLECIANYKNGKYDGLYEKYYKSGQLRCRANYKNDNRDGLYEEYHSDGSLIERCYYKNGVRNEKRTHVRNIRKS